MIFIKDDKRVFPLLRITQLLRNGHARRNACPHRLTGRQAPLKGKAPLVRFVGVVKPGR